jgi:exodeoxyribonuclease V beta subunit
VSAGLQDPPSFDVCGALPTQTTVLEASAGTGKTYTIAALTARYVAEGHAQLGELMLVTFGRMATNELRVRVRERLVSVERGLADVLAGRSPAPRGDEVERLLTSGSRSELAERHVRVARALSDFDAATIATTHELCHRMLGELGILGDQEPDVVFVEHLEDLTREVASDVYLRRYASGDRPSPMSHDDAQRMAQHVVATSEAELVPAPVPGADDPDQPDGPAAERVAFAHAVRREVQRRKDLGRLFTYDDMLTRLRDALADPAHGTAAVRRLRERYRIVLVDEFQDTDPVQWDILRRAFHGHATLVLIGDPKQAIYAFRGADVFSYLNAVQQADRVATLATNWRSDAQLVAALSALMGGAALGDERIVVRPVQAHHQTRRLLPADGHTSSDLPCAPVRVRVVPHVPDAERMPLVRELRPQVVSDLVADVTAMLSSGVRVATGGQDRALGPADVAVLVRRNERADVIRDALVAAGVPAVVLGATSVYVSSAASQWLTLLTALEQPRPAHVREAALTSFFGWTFGQLAAADDDSITDLTQTIRWWSRVVRARGVAALLEAVSTDTRLTTRLLAAVGGERELTDLRHVGQSLHAVMAAGQLGLGALLEWLRDRIRAARSTAAVEGMRRLETDAASVQILTVHRSKGLEFPVVYLPEAWDRHVSGQDEGATLQLHGECGRRVLDVGGLAGLGRSDRFSQSRREEDGEDLRLLYVALTRAQCQVVTWWAASKNTPASALQRFLRGPQQAGVEPAPRYEVQEDPLSTAPAAGISLERVAERTPVPWHPSPGGAPLLSVRSFARELDLEWRRTSYSALTAAVHGLDLSGSSVGSEAEPVKTDDEPVSTDSGPAVAAPSLDPGLARTSPMAELPTGAEFGTLVHGVLESVDMATADLPQELRRVAAEQLTRSPPGSCTADALAGALLPALQTPLGPLAGDQRLADFRRSDRLNELVFEMPLAGGDQAASDVRLGQLGPLLRLHLDPSDPLAPYPDLLEHPALGEQSLRGYLTGSIDAVLRVRRGQTPRYAVVDYKTNWLGSLEGETLTVGHYTHDRLAKAMMAAHYPLQALLYSVAVHRFLRWRQAGYDPDVHLGGVLYLFVRGMAGPDTPVVEGRPCGVFSWMPPARLITDLSDLLEGTR